MKVRQEVIVKPSHQRSALEIKEIRLFHTHKLFTDDYSKLYRLHDDSQCTTSIDKATYISNDILTYLNEPSEKNFKNLQQLNRHNYVKQLFLKYNTILPSSAPVERLFSFASKIIA